MLERLDPEGDPTTALQAIIDGAEVDVSWRELLVHHSHAIAYCRNRLIRWISEEEVYLLTCSQMNGMHSDLFTYCLFVEQVEELVAEGGLPPFTSCGYKDMKDTKNAPGIILETTAGDTRVVIEIMNSRDEEAEYVIASPWAPGPFLEKRVWPALANAGFIETKRADDSRVMESRVGRAGVIRALKELGSILERSES